MESGSRISYGGQTSTSRMDRLTMNQFVAIPQHSTLSQPRMATGGVNPLDLTSAIQHELRRSNSNPGWAPWNHDQQQQQQQQQQFDGSKSYASSLDADSTGFSIPCGSFHSGGDANSPQIIPLYIPRFDEGMVPGLHHMPNRFEFTPETESLGSACQGFYSGSRRSANEFAPAHQTQQVFETETQVDTTRSCSPWIERMMQADVTPTPSPINLCLSPSQGTVSCVMSQTMDLQSCHSSDRQAQSMRSAFSCDPQHESTLELSAEFCTDDDDLETRPLDVKRKKRMLSNRASAQRSRQRRQERLDQLEVMTAKLRVENSTLQKKLIAAVEVAKKFDGQNKDLLKKVDRLSKELEASGKRTRKLSATKVNDCANSQQNACARTCDMVGERPGVNPYIMRDDGGASTGTRSRSPSSSSPKGWPLGSYRSFPENNNNNNNNNNNSISNGGSNAGSNGRTNQGISSVRKSFSACRVESRKRSYDQSEGGFGETSPAAAAAMDDCSSGALESGRPFWNEVGQNNPFPGLDPSLKEDGDADCLEADRWLEFTGCFLL